MFTLFYAGATLLQSWRIKNVCNKIAEQLSQKASIVFYALSSVPVKDGYDVLSASSELCANRRSAKISQILWLNGKYRGCSLSPVQTISVSPWISFPKAPCLVPFACGPSKEAFHFKKDCIYLLLEAEIQPQSDKGIIDRILKIEDYGTPIAWKIDSHLAVLIATDISFFTRLLVESFLKNQYYINDQLPLVRIESINFDGTPQPFELLACHLRKASRSKQELNGDEWNKHLEDLHALSVLAQQAIIYESDKQRSLERSPGSSIRPPDVIPSKKNDKEVQTPTKPISKEAKVEEIEIQREKITPKLTKQKSLQSPTKQPLVQESKKPPNETAAATATKPHNSSIKIKRETSKEMLNVKTVETPKIISTAPPILSEDSKQEETPTTSTTTTTPLKSVEEKRKESTTTTTLTSNKINSNNIRSPTKPLNILVYSDIASVKQSALETLKELLPKNVYTIYPLTQQQLEQKYWLDNTALIVVGAAVASNVGEIIVDYFLRGGKVLSLCSDILHYILPTYRTAEVREHELVNFSYGKWQKVKMMHHIFCYQASPVKKNFSTEDSEESQTQASSKPGLVCPRSLELKDLDGSRHDVQVDVLGTEEIWNTPSLLIAKSILGGRAVFSQVHLEMQPSQFEDDESKYNILKQNDRIRLDILADLLSKHLGIDAKRTLDEYVYQNAFFLGRHESKFNLLTKLTSKYGGNIIQNSKLTLQFSGKGDVMPKASSQTLPILMHSCPDDFSTVEYFENLKTNYVGRLMIYAPIVTSSMNVINEIELENGLTVLVRQQTDGVGRSNNQWLSPFGCAMFSLQLHIDSDTNLGKRLPLIQHIIATAMVNAIKSHDQYKVLDIRIKWPNDIYANGALKIGGLVVKTIQADKKIIVNIGCGFNLDNKKPTTCLNDLIMQSNNANRTNMPPIKYEHFIAWILNEIESVIERIKNENFEFFYKLYYDLWLHSDQSIHIQDSAGMERAAKIIGIDDFGFLQVQLTTGSIETVQPDGNSFDMLKGLILPKQY